MNDIEKALLGDREAQERVTEPKRKRGRPVGTGHNKKRDAAMYDLFVAINGKTGTPRHTGILSVLAKRYGISVQAVSAAIKKEGERRGREERK